MSMKDWHKSQRGYFAGELYEQMKTNKDIYLLVGDLGYKVFDKHFKDFPDRCINCGASEQAMIGIAAGLAIKNKIPFVYSITPFLLYRPYETIRLYIDGEKLPVKLIGSGRDNDYAHDGPSHDATGAVGLLKTLPNIRQYFPETIKDASDIVKDVIKNNQPSFISLKR